jgi:hypothetical protein
MKGIYTYIPETNNVPKEYNIAAILSLVCMVPISLVRVLTLQCTFTLALSEVYYYYYYYYFLCSPARTMASSFSRFRDHTQRRATVARTPLDG